MRAVIEGVHCELFWLMSLVPPAYRFKHPNWDALWLCREDLEWYLSLEWSRQLHREIEEGDCGGVIWKA